MEAVYDFLRAALPWVAMGLLLAVFFARSAKRKKDEDKKADYGTVGIWRKSHNVNMRCLQQWAVSLTMAVTTERRLPEC